MGNTSSAKSSPQVVGAPSIADSSGAVSPPAPPPAPSLRKVELPADMQPTAAVIGAGIVGVHVAKELAAIGFKVTVIEPNAGPGLGATAHDCGVVVPSTFVASPWRLRFPTEFVLGSLPLSARSFLPAETPFGVFASVAWGRWAMSRLYQRRTSVASLERAGESMAISTVDAIRDALAADSRLRACVVGELSQGAAAAGSPDDGALIIDARQWTETMAKICEERLGVRFLYQHKALRIKTKITNAVEWSPYLVVKDLTKNPREPPLALGFDLTVVCAGTETRELTWLNDPVPVQAFGGYSLEAPLTHSIVAALRKSLGEAKLFGNISADGWIKAGPSISHRIEGSSLAGHPVLRIAGLASLEDTCNENPEVRDVALPLFNRRFRLHQSIEDGFSTSHAEENAALSVRRYSRGVTPDGLPIVSRLGRMKNVFVCSGFGDNGALLGPGAARLVANLVVARSWEDEITPYSLGRFRDFRYMDPTRHIESTVRFFDRVTRVEHALCRFGEDFAVFFQDKVVSRSPIAGLTSSIEPAER